MIPTWIPRRDDDLLSPDAVRNPYPLLAELRTQAPIHLNERYGALVLTRFEDVRAGLLDTSLSSDRLSGYLREREDQLRHSGAQTAFALLSRWLVFLDPPDHGRIRRLVNKAFTARNVRSLEPTVQQVADDLLDAIPSGVEQDWVRDFAFPLPVIVVSEILGVPSSDATFLKHWSDEISGFVFGSAEEDRHERAHHAVTQLAEYFDELVTSYRSRPADNLIFRLIQARDEDGQLSHDEVIATAMLLLFAGHETTSNLLAVGLLSLLEYPEVLETIRRDTSTIDAAVEELLRYDGPSKMVARLATEGSEVAGVAVPAGTPVLLVQAAAHRDDTVYQRPDVLDVTRTGPPHLGFGVGPHFCLGAPLARLEARVMLERLVARGIAIEADPDAATWHAALMSRGVKQVPITLSHDLATTHDRRT